MPELVAERIEAAIVVTCAQLVLGIKVRDVGVHGRQNGVRPPALMCQATSQGRGGLAMQVSMIININSWPGVGKLSVAERLQQRIGGRLLDNHTIFNVAFALCEFRSPEFFEAVRAVRRIAFTVASKLPPSVPIILTSAYADTPFGRENWAAIREMANVRAAPLCNIVLDCSLDENLRRLQSPGRAQSRKLTDPSGLLSSRQTGEILAKGGDHLLRFDVTELTPEQSTSRIVNWLHELGLVQIP